MTLAAETSSCRAVARACWTACRWRWGRAKWWACWAPTAPASRRCWARWPRELRAGGGALRLDGEDLSGGARAAGAPARVLPQKPGLGFDLGVAEVVAMGAYPFPELPPAAVEALVDRTLALADATHLRARRYPRTVGR